MVTRLGTILGTQLGTDLGSFGDGPPVFDASKLYALTNLANANYYTTQVGGGEAGDVTAGFGGASIYMLNQLLPTAGNTGALQGNYVFPTAGWRQEFTNPGSSTTMLGRIIATSGTGTPTRTMLGSDLGKVALTAFVDTGSFLRQYADDGTEIGAGIATTGFTPGTSAHRIGASASAGGFTYGHTLAWITWRGTPTQAQIKAMFSAVRAAAGDFPSKAAIEALMPGTTVTHRWSLRDTLAALNAPVIDSQAAPATIPDSVTAATVDVMTKAGSPVVRVLDPSLYPRTSYGALGAGGTNYFASAQNAGLVGSASGFSVAIIADLFALAATTTGYLYCQNAGDARGFVVYMISAVTLRFLVYDGSGAAVVADVALTAADMGRKALIVCQHEGSNIRTYLRGGTQVATAAITGYSVQTTNAYVGIGGYPVNNFSLTGGAVYDVATASAALTTGEITQLFTDFDNTGLIVPNAKHVHRWNFTQDVVSNGGASNGVPATSTDRIGSTGLTRTGTGLQVAQRTERLWSYETSPILYGASGYAAGVHLVSSAPLTDVGGAPCFYTMVYRPDAQAGTNAVQILASQLVGSTVPGVQWYIASTGTQLGFSMAGAGGAGFVAAQTAIAAADVGKLDLVMGVYTGAALIFYRKRVQAGTTAAGFTATAPSTALYLGSEAGGSPRVANGTSVFSLGMGLGVPTLAQYQAWFDATQAADGLIQPVPGMTDQHRWVLGASSGVPATVSDQGAAPLTLTRAGAPTLASQYARVFTA